MLCMNEIKHRIILEILLTENAQNYLGILEAEKRSKSGTFRANLVEFRGEKGPSQFVTQCYIWAFSG